ncbi:MAG: DUF4255 domain-containing protein [Planctomycetota bacterium]
MSSDQAIAAVTRKLRALIDRPNDGVIVTTMPPAEAAKNEVDQSLNLFLYQVLPNASRRNTTVNVRPGESNQAPLALDLQYALTAYLKDYASAGVAQHQILGEAMRVLHDNPYLEPGEIELSDTDATKTVLGERVSVTLDSPSPDEVSKWWSLFSTPYRITAFYQVSVVLLESKRRPKTAAPVAKLGRDDRGPTAQGDLEPPVPTMHALNWNHRHPTVTSGDEITISGHHLSGDKVVLRFENPAIRHLSASDTDGVNEIPVSVDNPREIKFKIPEASSLKWPAGQYQLRVVVTNEVPTGGLGTSSQSVVLESNVIPFSLAPQIRQIGNSNTTGESVRFALRCHNTVLSTQRNQVLVGSVPATITGVDDKVIQVTLPSTELESGTHPVRLRVDGVDSHLISFSEDGPPVYDGEQLVEIGKATVPT